MPSTAAARIAKRIRENYFSPHLIEGLIDDELHELVEAAEHVLEDYETRQSCITGQDQVDGIGRAKALRLALSEFTDGS